MQTGKSGTAKSRNDAIAGVLECPQSPEQPLVEAARRGHSSAFDGLCRRYTRQLQRTAFLSQATLRVSAAPGGSESVCEGGMSTREHPGKLNTKSAPNAWNGVTKPSGTGNELILDEISSALFAAKS